MEPRSGERDYAGVSGQDVVLLTDGAVGGWTLMTKGPSRTCLFP